MIFRRIAFLALLVPCLSWIVTGDGAAQTVTRGPYLQSATPNEITIRWRTDVATDARVRYGVTPGSLTSQTDDVTLTTEHEIVLTSLSPDTKYFYSVGTLATVLEGDTADYYFFTSPEMGTDKKTRIWVIGDSGQPGQGVMNVRDSYLSYTDPRRTNVWMMLGDNAYNIGTDAQYQAAVFDIFPTILRNTVLWPTRGNHDQLHSGANNDYYEIFSLPVNGQSGGVQSSTEAYYAFDYGKIHFICLDSFGSDRIPPSPMLTWLTSDLAANLQPWIVAFFHHPPYTKGSHDSDDVSDSSGRMRDMRENALPILEAGGVDLVLTGHSHSYERSFLLDAHYDSSSTLHDSMKVDDGDGAMWGDGAYLKPTLGPAAHEGAVYAVAGSSSKTTPAPLNHPVMVTSLLELGSMVIDIDGDQLNAVFIDDNGVVLDQFTIIKGMTPTGITERVAHPTPRLEHASPNPFQLSTKIGYSLPSAGGVTLTVYDVKGRRVRQLVRGERHAGIHLSVWDGRDSRGREVAPGVYFSVLEYGSEKRARKLVRVR